MTPQELAKIKSEYYARFAAGESASLVNSELQVKTNTPGVWRSYPGIGQPWWSFTDYRWKPKTVIVNGVEVPEPMREYPKTGTYYWTLSSLLVFPSEELLVTDIIWEHDPRDLGVFRYGIFYTEEDAQAYFSALIPKVRNIV